MPKESLIFWHVSFLAVLLVLFGVAKLRYNPSIGMGAFNGKNYYQSACLVKDGNSLSTSVTTLAQTLSTDSRSDFHSATCSNSGSTTLAILRHSSAANVIVYPHHQKRSFLKDIGMVLDLETAFGTDKYQMQVFRYVAARDTET